MTTIQHLIHGQLTDGQGGRSADVFNPATGEAIRRVALADVCLLYTSPSPRDLSTSRMPSSA